MNDTATQQFVIIQIQRHSQHQQHRQQYLNIHILRNAISHIPTAIFHCEDHFPSRLMWYCPTQYDTAVTRTQRLGEAPRDLCVTEAKKQYAKSRPVVSFVGAMLRPLAHDLADSRHPLPHAHAGLSTILGQRRHTHYQLWALREAFHTMQQTSDEEQFRLSLYNQDLSGFCASISSDRFIASLQLVTHWCRGKRHEHAATFTSAHTQPLPAMRLHLHLGKSHTPKQHRHTIHIQHLPDICKALLLLNYCLLGDTLPAQARGAPMGSPGGGAVRTILDTHTHTHEHEHLPHPRTTSSTLSHRPSASAASAPHGMSTTAAPSYPPPTSFPAVFITHFYGPPKGLETEPGLDFPGFSIDPRDHSTQYNLTANLADIMFPQSASPPAILRSSFAARAILAGRLTTPTSAVDTAMQQLTEVYTRAGYFACSAPIMPGMQLHDLQTYHIPALNCRHPWQLFAPSICKQFECAMSSPTALSRTCLKRNVLHWLMLLMLCCPRAAQFKRGRRQHIEKFGLIQQFR